MKQISEMSKDELGVLAAEHGKMIDKRRKVEELRTEVQSIILSGISEPVEVKPKDTPVKYLKHPVNGRVFLATEHLLSRGDMLPCDESGTEV